MAGNMIRGMFPELFGTGEELLQRDADRQAKTLGSDEAFIGDAMSRFKRNTRKRVGQLTNRDLRTGEEKFRASVSKLNPQAPNYWDAVLALAQTHVPEQVPALKPHIDQMKAQAAQERRAEAAAQRDADRFALEKEQVNFRMADSNRRFGLEAQRLGLSERQVAQADQRLQQDAEVLRRNALQFAFQMEDRDSRDVFMESLRAKDQEFLADAVQAGMPVGEAARQSAMLDASNVRALAAAASSYDPDRDKPDNEEVDVFVDAAFGQLKSEIESSTFPRGKKTVHAKQLLRTFFAGGGYRITDPVQQLEAAKAYVLRGQSRAETPAEEVKAQGRGNGLLDTLNETAQNPLP